ncbi:MAG: MMPL family transporter [Acidimicrobiia bacterium]|nr:MMPL family transporter [Acidimicrobiia bacterium]
MSSADDDMTTWERIGATLARRSGTTLGVVAAVTLLLATGLLRLDFATGQESYLNEGTQVYDDNVVYQDLFGGQAMVTLFAADDGSTVLDLFTPENVAEMRSLEEELRSLDGVQNVVSPLTALEFTQTLVTPEVEGDITTSPAAQILLRASERELEAGNAAAAEARSDDTLATAARLLDVPEDERTFDNPDWVEFLLVDNQGDIRAALRPFFPFPPGVEPTVENAANAQMVTRVVGNASIEVEGETADAVVAASDAHSFENFSVITTGAPVLLKDINDYLRGGMLTLGGIAVVVMLVILTLAFRVRTRLLPLATTLIGIVWTFGMLGYVGLDLSLVTISGLPILIGMGIDFAIQIHSRVEEELATGEAPNPFAATLRWLGWPLVVAAIAAVVSFLCMQLSMVPMVRDFGVMLAIGMVMLVAVGVLVPLAALGSRERRSPSTDAALRRGPMERIVVRLGALPAAAAIPLAILATGLFAFGVLAEDAFEIESDPEKWVDQDTQVIADISELRAKTGSAGELGIYLESADGVLTDEMAELGTTLAMGQLAEHPDQLITASSIYTTVFLLMDIPGASPLPPTGEDVQLAFEAAPEDVRKSVVARDGTAANLIFRVGEGTLADRNELIIELEEQLADGTIAVPAGARATPSGLAVVGAGLLQNVEANRAVLTYAALAAVALWLLIRYRSLTRTSVALVPVAMAVGTSSLVIAAANFQLSPLTTISGPLVIATCTEFSSLILARYLEERERGLSPEAASTTAGARTGKAFVTSALTTIGGFGVLIFSALPLLRDFGAIVTLNIAVALLSALIVQPPLLIFADRKGWLRAGPAAA